jgi:hypothetical protein
MGLFDIFEGPEKVAKSLFADLPDPIHDLFDKGNRGLDILPGRNLNLPNPGDLGFPSPGDIFGNPGDSAPKIGDPAKPIADLFGDISDSAPKIGDPLNLLPGSSENFANLTGLLDFGPRDITHQFARDIMGAKDPLSGRTAAELMNTLDAYGASMAGGFDPNHISRNELKNFLKSDGDIIDPQDRADLQIILRNFDRISKADHKDGNRGISTDDMMAFVARNQKHDRQILSQRDTDLASTWPSDTLPTKDLPSAPVDQTNQQQSVWTHHELPTNPPPGFGGHIADGDTGPLKWNTPTYHSIKYDSAREGYDVRANLEELLPVIRQLPTEDAQRAFTEAFFRTQAPVLAANGAEFIDARHEVLKFRTKEGQVTQVDTIIDFSPGGKNEISWQNSDSLPPDQQGKYDNHTPLTPDLLAQIKGALTPEQLADPKVQAVLNA